MLLKISSLATPEDVTPEDTSKCEHKIKLFALSSGSPESGIVNYHEGAGITYPFITGVDAPINILNSCLHMMYQPFDQNHFIYWNTGSSGLVQISVLEPKGYYDLVKDKLGFMLSVNGDTNGWAACKNTGDPYSISKTLYQVKYYNSTSTLPIDCKRVRINAVYV